MRAPASAREEFFTPRRLEARPIPFASAGRLANLAATTGGVRFARVSPPAATMMKERRVKPSRSDRCSVCGQIVRPDDPIVLSHGELIHRDCAEHHGVSGAWPQTPASAAGADAHAD